jgi:regulator of protease activity HflC (stomatin/prohibitin superfamily)
MKNIRSQITLMILISIAMFSGCSVIKPGYNSMKNNNWGKGLKTDQIYSDGVVWHWPWVRMIDYSLQWQTYSEKVAILTEDELHINLTVSVTLRPKQEELPLLELEVGQDYYNSIVKPEFISITRNVFSSYKYSRVSPESPIIEDQIFKTLINKTAGKHLQFDNVTVDHIEYPEIVTSAVNRKLAVEQAIEQKDYELKIAAKDAEIQRTLAKGQRDAQQIIDAGLTPLYLQYKALEVQDKLSTSVNAKFFFVPVGKDGLPIIVDAGTNYTGRKDR